MFSHEFTCPSCGAPAKIRTQARSFSCSYCGQMSHINADSLQAVGEKHLLIDYGSVFQVGQTGIFDNREFQVLGRLRLDYDDGFWDEWYIQFLDDGKEAWIQEDDGSFVLFEKEKELDRITKPWEIEVGSMSSFYDQFEPVFITSRSKASVNGGEGELPFRVVPGEPADFIDGIWDGNVVSVELLPDAHILFVGYPFQLDQVRLG